MGSGPPVKYYVNRVAFSDLRTVLALFKANGKSLEEVLGLFSDPANRERARELFPEVEAARLVHAMRLRNIEQRMAALAMIDAKRLLHGLDAESVDRQTVFKTQTRWNSNGEARSVRYKDVYELFRIEGARFFEGIDWAVQHGVGEDVYCVRCECPSTQRVYFLYVPREVGEAGDAIAAVAWTMQFEGRPLTKDEYLNLMYTET